MFYIITINIKSLIFVIWVIGLIIQKMWRKIICINITTTNTLWMTNFITLPILVIFKFTNLVTSMKFSLDFIWLITLFHLRSELMLTDGLSRLMVAFIEWLFWTITQSVRISRFWMQISFTFPPGCKTALLILDPIYVACDPLPSTNHFLRKTSSRLCQKQ